MGKYTQTTPQVQLPPVPSYAEKSFLHTTGAAVAVPFQQAAIISLAVGVASFILWVRYGAYWSDAALNALTVTVIVFLLAFIYLLRHWFALTIEKTFDIDIPGLGDEPVKTAPAEVWVKKINSGGSYQADLRTFHISEDKLMTFAKAMVNGLPISRRYWMKHGFSDGEYRQFQSDNIKFGFWEAAGEGSNAGFVLTDEGESFYYGYAGVSPTPDEGEDENPGT
jgi:hypothetical protein